MSDFVIALRYINKVRGNDILSGLIRLHILHHAAREGVFGLGIIKELARHGYSLSPGTLYPLLRAMEHRGYLHSSRQQEGQRLRRFYRATSAGRRILRDARKKVRELLGEPVEGEPETEFKRRKGSHPFIPSISWPVLGTTDFTSAWGSAAGMLLTWEPFDFGVRKANVGLANALGARAEVGLQWAALRKFSGVWLQATWWPRAAQMNSGKV